jgi:ApaG protein
MNSAPYLAVSHKFRVTVRPQFLAGQSNPQDNQYMWSYTIIIENLSPETATLKTRHWQITDARGYTAVVNGDGVVGEQPTLAPGESFEYTSGCPLPTPSGVMVGRYGMEGADGRQFQISIPAFSLDSPHEKPRLN